MSTTNYLDSLDYDQLKFCRDECEARIRAIQEEEKKVVNWYLLAAVKKPGAHYIVISINKQPPTVVQEGEALPDGSRLLDHRIAA